jgi:hypothetical protein
MKKMIALISSCLLFAGVKAQTGAPVSKETTKPAVTGTAPVPSPAVSFNFFKSSPHYFGTTVTTPPKK